MATSTADCANVRRDSGVSATSEKRPARPSAHGEHEPEIRVALLEPAQLGEGAAVGGGKGSVRRRAALADVDARIA